MQRRQHRQPLLSHSLEAFMNFYNSPRSLFLKDIQEAGVYTYKENDNEFASYPLSVFSFEEEGQAIILFPPFMIGIQVTEHVFHL
jgi:hypothetical protein